MRNRLLLNCWPLLGSKMTTGLTSKKGKPIVGDFIILPQTPDIIFNNLREMRKKVKQAVILGRKLGSKSIGLGALIPPLVSGGKYLEEECGVSISTGSSLNAWIVYENLKQAAQRLGMCLEDKEIRIIGSSLQTAKNVAHALNGQCKKIILADTKGKVFKLESLKQALEASKTATEIEIDYSVESKIESNILLIFSSVKGILPPIESLPPGALVIDDTQPRAISREYEKAREDIIFMEGGIIKLSGFNPSFRIGLENKDEMWGCLAETILKAYMSNNDYDPSMIDFSTNPEGANELIGKVANEAGFCLTEPRNRGKETLTPEIVSQFKKILSNK